MSIKYSAGYKYQLEEQTGYETGIALGVDTETDYFKLDRVGRLTIYKGYAWDGPSGGVDSKNFLRASLIHDVLCQAIGDDLIPQRYQIIADQLLKKIAIEDGMWKVRAEWVYRAVRFHFRGGGKPEGREILLAP